MYAYFSDFQRHSCRWYNYLYNCIEKHEHSLIELHA